MKYGVEHQLPAALAELAQRFHAALLLRMYQVQTGARPAIADPLDAALAAMHRWAQGEHAQQLPQLDELEAVERPGFEAWARTHTALRLDRDMAGYCSGITHTAFLAVLDRARRINDGGKG